MLAKAVRGVAAGTKDRDTQEYILQSSKQVLDQSVALIREAKNAVEAPNQPNKQLRLAQVRTTGVLYVVHVRVVYMVVVAVVCKHCTLVLKQYTVWEF